MLHSYHLKSDFEDYNLEQLALACLLSFFVVL